MCDRIAALTRRFCVAACLQKKFAEYFGPGGLYVGYINHVTSALLRNIDAAAEQFNATFSDDAFVKSNPGQAWPLKSKVRARCMYPARGQQGNVVQQLQGVIGQPWKTPEELREKVRQALNATHADNAEFIAAGERLVNEYLSIATKSRVMRWRAVWNQTLTCPCALRVLPTLKSWGLPDSLW